MPGALAGAGQAALRNPQSRRALILAVTAAILVPAMIVAAVLTSVTSAVSAVTGRVSGLGAQAISAASQGGLGDAELKAVVSASGRVGVPWPVVAAATVQQQYAVGGDGPFHAVSGTPGAPTDANDGQAYVWLANAVLTATRGVPGLNPRDDIGAYADRSTSGQLLLNDLHAERVREPWVSALSTMPLMGVDQSWAEAVIDRAVTWRMGVAGPMAGGCLPIASQPPAGSAPEPITLTVEQTVIAQKIAARVAEAKLGESALVIAYMTALAESRMRNLPGGDRDSAGVFQQRPSQGWGTHAQVTDVDLATDAFLGVAAHTTNRGLTDIASWASMAPGDAAQLVQGSAFPDAYAAWEGAARWLAATYGTGVQTPVDTSCPWMAGGGELGDCQQTLGPIESQLQPMAIHMGRCLKSHFPGLFEPIGGWRPCDSIAPDHPSGLAIDAMVPDYRNPARVAAVTKAAEWIMANAKRLGVRYLIWRQRKWNVDIDSPMPWTQWRPMEDRGSDTQNHFDHIHSTVYGPEVAGWQC